MNYVKIPKCAMAKWFLMLFFYIVLCVVTLLPHNVAGQANNVSPKLDFDNTEYKNNSDVPILPGVLHDKTDGKQIENASGNEKGRGSSGSDTNADKNTKSGPKIHGVRVTVDTGGTQTSKESKESVEVIDVGKHKKRVGIHTDITFEISTDCDGGSNTTSSEQNADKEDASVPIYKGRSSGTTTKSQKPYDPKTRLNPNFSAERRSYDGIDRPGPAYYYPQNFPHNVPAYFGSGDSRGSGVVYQRGNGWNTYVPNNNLWTTERTYNENYQPNAVTAHRTGSPSWKPCYCISGVVDGRTRRENSRGPSAFLQSSSSPIVKMVDGKLNTPFSNK